MSEPIIEQETEGLVHRGQGMASRSRGRSRGRGWLRPLARLASIVALVPVVLTLLYLPSFVHPVSTLMLKDLATFSGYDRRWVPLDEIAPVLAHSVIMSEDGQFCSHHGVDLGELRAVVNDALAGGGTRGASTITMQTVKNLYLWQKPFSTARKVVELPLAVYFDLVMPKRRIMEIYLNIAEWGPGIYGIEAAAQHHFGVPAAKLTRRQAALLAVTLPNPQARNPARPGPGLRRLASLIERRAARAGSYVGCLKSARS
ncbi:MULTISPECIES: biosynthetic peptidoglycan transglycosylase [Pseudomonadota]|uniref:Biosynthetic peptidoglycan transglycosylase n=1 Tax=Aquamicrobium defluvii TaxID=69279 RepID=A0A011UVX1_9HYPH|nr:peptidoglycan transglycosylase [Aquamicrobium defluvii]EZQ17543.1 peptidoglycan transglycosylase [Halopseudomonas bauzanensis]TDR37162.1 monofunctional biosynthetic peptidoglycan transglycosylase [Aquamicrobium defluvii]